MAAAAKAAPNVLITGTPVRVVALSTPPGDDPPRCIACDAELITVLSARRALAKPRSALKLLAGANLSCPSQPGSRERRSAQFKVVWLLLVCSQQHWDGAYQCQ